MLRFSITVLGDGIDQINSFFLILIFVKVQEEFFNHALQVFLIHSSITKAQRECFFESRILFQIFDDALWLQETVASFEVL